MRRALILSIALTLAPTPTLAEELRAPGFGLVAQVGTRAQLVGVAAHHKGLPIGDKTFVSVITYGEFLDHTALVALRPQGKKWAFVWKYLLKRPIDTMGDDDKGRQELSSCNVQWEKEERVRPKVFLQIADVDHDGKLEAVVRVADCIIHRAVGPANERRLYIVNVDGTRRLALKADLDYSTVSWRFRGKEKFQDLNKDGHPDVSIRRRTLQGNAKKPTVSTLKYLWQKESDQYQEKKKGKL